MNPRAALGRALGVELARMAGRLVRPLAATSPSPPVPRGTAQWAQEVLGLSEAQGMNRIIIQAAWKARITCCHPDTGGSGEAAQDANLARDILLARLDT